jgi:hypothetical protein
MTTFTTSTPSSLTGANLLMLSMTTAETPQVANTSRTTIEAAETETEGNPEENLKTMIIRAKHLSRPHTVEDNLSHMMIYKRY